MTRAGPCALVAASFITAALLAFPAGSASSRDVCHLFDGSERVSQTLYMELEGTRIGLSVPKIYLEDAWDRVEGVEVRAQLFRVMIDDFVPVPRRHSSTLHKMDRHDYFTFLLQDLYPLDVRAVMFYSFAAQGVKNDNPDFAADPARFFTPVETEFGLNLMVPAPEIETQRDLLFATDDRGEVSAILMCGRDGEVPFPRCSHDFRSHGMDILADYRREYLEDWKGIQQDIETFLGCIVRE